MAATDGANTSSGLCRLLHLPEEIKARICDYLGAEDCFRLTLASKALRYLFSKVMFRVIRQRGPPVLYLHLVRHAGWNDELIGALAGEHTGASFTPEFAQSNMRSDIEARKQIEKYETEPNAIIHGIIALGIGWRDKRHRIAKLMDVMSEAAQETINWTSCLMQVLRRHMSGDRGSDHRRGLVTDMLKRKASTRGEISPESICLDRQTERLSGMQMNETDCQGIMEVDGRLEQHPVGLLLNHLTAQENRPDPVVVIDMALAIAHHRPLDHVKLFSECSPHGVNTTIYSFGNLLSFAIRAYTRLCQSLDPLDVEAKELMPDLLGILIYNDDGLVHGCLEEHDIYSDIHQAQRHQSRPDLRDYVTSGAVCSLTSLMQAVYLNDIPLAAGLIVEGAKVAATDGRGRTALMYCRDVMMADRLLSYGAELQQTTTIGNVLHGLLFALSEQGFAFDLPLQREYRYGHALGPAPLDSVSTLALIKYLFECAGDDDARRALASQHNQAGVTPLALAISLGLDDEHEGAPDIVDAIAYYADVNASIRYSEGAPTGAPVICDTFAIRFQAWHARRPLWIVFDHWVDSINSARFSTKGWVAVSAIKRCGQMFQSLMENGADDEDREARDRRSVRDRARGILDDWTRREPRSELDGCIRDGVLDALQ